MIAGDYQDEAAKLSQSERRAHWRGLRLRVAAHRTVGTWRHWREANGMDAIYGMSRSFCNLYGPRDSDGTREGIHGISFRGLPRRKKEKTALLSREPGVYNHQATSGCRGTRFGSRPHWGGPPSVLYPQRRFYHEEARDRGWYQQLDLGCSST